MGSQMCLRHYNMDATAVINAVLEDNLPEYLKEVDFALSSIPAFIFEVRLSFYWYLITFEGE